MPQASGTMGENIPADTFDFRVLDYVQADRFYYPSDPASIRYKTTISKPANSWWSPT